MRCAVTSIKSRSSSTPVGIDDLIRRGRALRVAHAARAGEPSTAADTRIWQHDCEAVITQLSGGSKAHWLSRAYSEALLVRDRWRTLPCAKRTHGEFRRRSYSA